MSLQWRHNGHDSVSNYQPHDYLLNRLFRRRSKKTSKLCVTGLCAGNSPGTGEFPAQMASNAENISIWWRYHGDNRNLNISMHVWICACWQLIFIIFQLLFLKCSLLSQINPERGHMSYLVKRISIIDLWITAYLPPQQDTKRGWLILYH